MYVLNHILEVIIPLNSTTLHNLLTCSNPTNLFDVFNLESLIDFIFGQIYASLDKLQEQQAEFFDSSILLVLLASCLSKIVSYL